MSATVTKVSPEVIEAFLNGNNPKKYVVGVEASYNKPIVSLIINDPERGKYIEEETYKPFLWFKDELIPLLYGGSKLKSIEAAQRHGVTTKRLKISDSEGNTPERLRNGFRYLVICKKSYNDLIYFFREGGVDVFDRDTSKLFFMFTPVEQFMIQTGIRLFKGMDDYNDLHRFQFDLETEGLYGSKDAIFQIGMRDNRGFEHVLESEGNTLQEKRDSERTNIIKFFQVIDALKPDIITGYNSEAFDWKFIVDRCERLSLPIEHITFGLDGKSPLKRKPSMLKLGNEMEAFEQTFLWGHNIIDISHAVRRAQAINTDIKGWGLKYITQFSDVAKKNRVYIPGDKIYTIWNDGVSDFAFNDTNGDWYKISERMSLKDDYKSVKGNYIVQRYLLDDLWETEQIDGIFNQAAFLLSKILPTTYSRSSTMGTATQWKLIMAAWSYENGLAIPVTEPKRDFTGGLSRLLEVGYSRNIVKLDYAALYPKTQLTHGIFPNLDISGVMEGLLTYIVDTRDEFKFLKEKHEEIIDGLVKEIEKLDKTKHSKAELNEELKKNKSLKGLYDKKQLPLKLLANSWFGAYGAPYLFNWGDSDCAEETTCRGRQYFRLMVKHFFKKHGFKPLIGDTDGFNFTFPDDIDKFKYVANGTHWKTKQNTGLELSGLNAVLAEFNETYMIGRMGLDIDAIYNSGINFSRKNYANDKNGKIKFVGNSIKSKKMPVYIEEFLNKAIRLLLDGKGKEFINYYYEYVDKIYNYNIPLVKIASKSKVKSTLSEYRKKAHKKNKAGNPMPKQAHMELAIRNNLDVGLGDTLYYVNTGTAKSHGDLKSVKLENGTTEITLNCKLIDVIVVEGNLEMIREMESLRKILAQIDKDDAAKIEEIEANIKDMESKLLTEEYNVAKYLEAFNKKVKPLLVCFHPDIRENILLNIKKDKKTKLESLDDRKIFTEIQSQLVSGFPNKPEDQDTYDELMAMEDKEIKFWDKVNKIPNNMEEEIWNEIRTDYHVRLIREMDEGIKFELTKLDDMFKRLEVEDLRKIEKHLLLPDEMLIIASVDTEGNFVSRKWGIILYPVNDMFKYEQEAIERGRWYQMESLTSDDKYDLWLEYKKGEKIVSVAPEVLDEKITRIDKLKENITKSEKSLRLGKTNVSIEEDEDEEEEEDEIDDFIPDLQKIDFQVEQVVAQKIGNIIPKRIRPYDEPIESPLIVEAVKNLEGKIFFPDKVETAKDLLSKIKSFPKIEKEDDEWNF